MRRPQDPSIIRGWLRFYEAVAKDETYEKEARIINKLVPLMIEQLTEEELADLWDRAETQIAAEDKKRKSAN